MRRENGNHCDRSLMRPSYVVAVNHLALGSHFEFFVIWASKICSRPVKLFCCSQPSFRCLAVRQQGTQVIHSIASWAGTDPLVQSMPVHSPFCLKLSRGHGRDVPVDGLQTVAV